MMSDMRTTLRLEDDIMEIARSHARRHRITLGKAVSDLLRKGAQRNLETDKKNGLKLVRLSKNSPRITSEKVEKLLEEIP